MKITNEDFSELCLSLGVVCQKDRDNVFIVRGATKKLEQLKELVLKEEKL